MKQSHDSLVAAFGELRALVVGDAMLDCYIEGSSGRVAPEAPVPVVDVSKRTEAAGGAANVAANLAALSATTSLLAPVGDDSEGAALRARLERAQVDCSTLLSVAGRATLAKKRVVADGQVLVRLDSGGTEPLSAHHSARLAGRLKAAWEGCDAVVVSDYGYGAVGPHMRALLRDLQASLPKVVVVDAKDPGLYSELGATALTPNFGQARALLPGRLPAAEERLETLLCHSEELVRASGARIVAVTLDSDGALILEHDRHPYRLYATPERRSHTAGAGDTFAACLALALAAGAETPAAAELAGRAAAIAVARPYTTTCAAAELSERVGEGSKLLRSTDALARAVASARSRGRRIVFTNGCFDIIHRGHVTYLSEAKALGDVLVVGVNSDRSVRSLKGEGRPVNGIDDRLEVLAALSCVDLLVTFDDPTPERLLRVIRPDVFVKGGDYTLEMLPEAGLVHELGGEVRILGYLEQRSTSNVIARLAASAPGS